MYAIRSYYGLFIDKLLKKLDSYARQVFDGDLLADKQNPAAGRRQDADRFILPAGADQEEQVP